MAKALNKAYKRLDQRIKSWEQTCRDVGSAKANAYRKPGSMKRK